MLPTTNIRFELRTECLAHLSDHYGSALPDAQQVCRSTVMHVLHLPEDGRPLTRTIFHQPHFHRALIACKEIAEISRHLLATGEPDTLEVRLAVEAAKHLNDLVQSGATQAQLTEAYLDAMVGVLIEWLSFTDGGVADAIRALDVAMQQTGRH